jgi:hypothetical protein
MKLYHGSNKYIENELIPHKSFHYEPLVYATSDLRYALVRAGKFDINKLTFKEDYDGMIITLIELVPNAFEEVFDTDGYIYEVDDSTFERTDDLMPNEYICHENCPIIKTIRIRNIGEEIEQMMYPYIQIIKYEDSEDYWKTVRGGREGYLQRRRERVEKLNKDKIEV